MGGKPPPHTTHTIDFLIITQIDRRFCNKKRTVFFNAAAVAVSFGGLLLALGASDLIVQLWER